MNQSKHLFVVFTLGVSLFKWHEIGILDREIQIYKSYIKEGWNITFLTYGDYKDREILNKFYGDRFQLIALKGRSNIFSKFDNQYINILYSIKAIFILFFYRKKIDLVKSSQLYGCWVCAIFSLINKKPWLSRTGYDFFAFLKFDISKKNNFFERMLKIFFLKWIHLIFGNMANSMIVSSEKDYENTNKWFNGEIIINKNWVYIPKFSSENFKIKSEKLVSNKKLKLIIIGRLEYQKRIDLAIDALNEAKIDFSLDIYGNGSQLLNLKKNINNSISKKIKFLGNLENKKLIKTMKNYDILISTSEIEGTPKVILEAMASGLIILARKCRGNSDLINNEKNGYLFDDKKSFLRILEDFRKIPSKEIENMLINNYTRICEKHCFEKFAELEISLAKKILK